MKIFTLDVETANANYSSICQIALVEINSSEGIKNDWCTLINPEDFFDPFNSSIHGITENDVRSSPRFSEIFHQIQERIREGVIVHHSAFDRISVERACQLNNLGAFNVGWLDSTNIVRRTWPQFHKSGYGLANVASFLGKSFSHHDALSDSRVLAEIILEAEKVSEKKILDWYKEFGGEYSKDGSFIRNSNYARYPSTIKKEGDKNGPLFGDQIVFTGELNISRENAAVLASGIGCTVTNSVTKKTTIVVVGIQDFSKLAGKNKSSKHLKAEELIKKGYPIRILSEDDFFLLCNQFNSFDNY